jgi:FdhD protein
VAGFLVSEGIVRTRDELRSLAYCSGRGADGANTYNVLDAELQGPARHAASSLRRSLTTSSSCGLCGKARIEDVRTVIGHCVADDDLRLDVRDLLDLPERLRSAQEVFDRTGGLHAAGLFDATTGALLVVREDIGRHNAVDKVIGWALREDRLPLRQGVLVVSGRASFELVQKAAMAGLPVLCAVSAASSLAAELADETGMTLAGFVRGDRLVVYAGAQRVVLDAACSAVTA